VSQCINPYHLKEGPENRLAGIRARTKKGGDNARPVNIDGKTIRGSGFHVVSVRVGEHGLTLGQLTAEGKSNGISAVPKLPEITGDIVTADAMSCRTETALKIWEKWADYILALKEKQKTLYHNTKDYFEGTGSVEIDELPKDLWQGEEEKGHGRKERREVRTVTDIERTGNKAAWQDVKTLIQYRTFRTVGWKGNSTNG
jgi:predicted transposase YbfD/YdcC